MVEGPPLTPADPELAAEMERLVRGVDSFVSAGLDLLAGRTGRWVAAARWGGGAGHLPASWFLN